MAAIPHSGLIQLAPDFGGTAPGAGTDGYTVAWNNTTGVFELVEIDVSGDIATAIAAHEAAADPHLGYAFITVSATEPPSPRSGSAWFDSDATA